MYGRGRLLSDQWTGLSRPMRSERGGCSERVSDQPQRRAEWRQAVSVRVRRGHWSTYLRRVIVIAFVLNLETRIEIGVASRGVSFCLSPQFSAVMASPRRARDQTDESPIDSSILRSRLAKFRYPSSDSPASPTESAPLPTPPVTPGAGIAGRRVSPRKRSSSSSVHLQGPRSPHFNRASSSSSAEVDAEDKVEVRCWQTAGKASQFMLSLSTGYAIFSQEEEEEAASPVC